MNSNSSLSLGFEFLDIEIIDHKKESGSSNEKWNCDMCSLFFLSKDRLLEHKNKHAAALEEAYKCKYCNKTLSIKEESKESYANQKCNTCEYKCSKCSLRFQRYSSFVNHEKSHSLLKKKKSISIKKKHVRGSEPPNNNVPKKHYTDKIPTVLQKNSKRKRINDEHKISAVSPKKRRTLPGALLNEKSKPLDTKDTLQKNNATTELITCSTTEEKTLGENKKNNKASLVTDPVNTSSHDNIVNYKPFSCHICGENFASGDHLLVHIQTHGENVSKGFKCKHCSEEFADIYKMQYHLAICPLAEDETTFVKNIPPKLHITPSSGMPRKQGRPKKIKHEPTNDDMDYCPTSSISTRGSLKKKSRNDENSEPIKKLPKILNSSSPKYSTRSRRNTAFKPDENNVTLSNEFVDSACSIMSDDEIGGQEDPLNVSVGYIDKENVTVALNDSYDSVNDDKPKVHSCPFPRCGIKFTREKALLCHMRNHNDDFEDSYKCHKCDIPFDDIHSLRSHLNECKDIKEENEDNVSEPEYKDDFTSPDKSFLKKRKDFTCNICGQVYPSQEKMKRHLALHGSTNFICRICKDVFINQSLLDEHFVAKHPQKSSYHCEICNEDFISELFLNIHETEYHAEPVSSQPTDESVDENEQSKSSTVCLKTLKSHNYCTTVTSYRLNFSNMKQCWCPVCFKCFQLKENMRLHFQTDHIFLTGSVYICEVCETEKPNAEMLCYHLEMHSSNLLSVNRFSNLRGCVIGKESKNYEFIPNKGKVMLKNNNGKDLIPLNKTYKAKVNVTQRKLKISKSKSKKKILKKVRKVFKNSASNPPLENALGNINSKGLTKSSYLPSSKLSRNKNIRNDGNVKLTLETDSRKGKINNRNKRLTVRKQTKPRKNVQRKVKTIDKNRVPKAVLLNSASHASFSKDVENNLENDNWKEHGDKSSDEDNKDNIHRESSFMSEHKNQAKAGPIEGSDENTEDVKHNYNKKITYSGNEVSKTSSYGKNVDGDSCDDSGEEICCSMCSMVFYHQDELLDHVATHI